MLEIKDLYAGYKNEGVLFGIDLAADKGEIITLVGKNGCGKTTLLKCIMGMLEPARGSVTLDKKPLGEHRARHIAYLSQGKNIPDITVYRMVLHGRFPYLSYPRRYGKGDKEKAEGAMEKMGISHLAHKPLSQLSGGMRQKVYIAMALCQEADIILMDEPTTYLDIEQQLKLFEIIKELAREGKTVIMVLHDILCALSVSHRIAVLDGGRITANASPDKIIASGIIKKTFGVELRTTENPYYIE